MAHPESCVTAFREYISLYKKFMGTNPSDKMEKELDLMKVVYRNVSLKCRDGSYGCATAIYQFLTDETANKRSKNAFECIKDAPVLAEQRRLSPAIPSMDQKRRSFPPQGKFLKKVPANLQCFNCKGNHFVSRCPLKN